MSIRSKWLNIAASGAVLAAGALGGLGFSGSSVRAEAPSEEPAARPLEITQTDQPAAPVPGARPRPRPARKTPPPKPRSRAEPGRSDAQNSPPAPPAGDKSPAAAPTPAAPPAAEPKPAPAPQAAGPSIGEFQPVIHARNAKITTCMDTIVGQSGSVIDSAHTAISSWSASAPNDNAFQSIIGLSYPNKSAPNALDVIFAAPLGPARCQGETIQVYPTTQPCGSIQAALIKEGRTIATLQALPVIEMKNGTRDILLPTAGGGCVIVAVAIR